MLMIILTAFANFFFVLNNNSLNDPSYAYVGEFVKQPVVDSMIAMYLMGLGEFADMDGYKEGPNVYIAWFFFLMGTFLVLVVFMNMLIAIMGDTFGNVQQIQEESTLQEQCKLIGDFIWLLDLQEVFAGKRYIIRLTPDMSINEQAVDLQAEISALGTDLKKKSDHHNTYLLRRLEAFEKNSRMLIKTQQAVLIKKVKQIVDDGLSSQKKFIEAQKEDAAEEEDDD